jgi:hypothetical protein
MASVLNVTPTCKPLKVYRATLRDEPGALTKLAGEILFFHDTGEITTIEPDDCVWLCVLGEVGQAQAQAFADRRHGGAAAIACSRMQEVA